MVTLRQEVGVAALQNGEQAVAMNKRSWVSFSLKESNGGSNESCVTRMTVEGGHDKGRGDHRDSLHGAAGTGRRTQTRRLHHK